MDSCKTVKDSTGNSPIGSQLAKAEDETGTLSLRKATYRGKPIISEVPIELPLRIMGFRQNV